MVLELRSADNPNSPNTSGGSLQGDDPSGPQDLGSCGLVPWGARKGPAHQESIHDAEPLCGESVAVWGGFEVRGCSDAERNHECSLFSLQCEFAARPFGTGASKWTILPDLRGVPQ